MTASRTFQDIIREGLKTPDAFYNITREVHTFPVWEKGQFEAVETVDDGVFPGGSPRSLKPNHVVMGFGGLFTFDLAAASKPPPAGLLLCDINSDQGMFWGAFLPLIAECETAVELRGRFSAMPGRAIGKTGTGFPRRIEFMMPEQVKGAGGPRGRETLQWLYDEEKYKIVRDLVREGKVAHITLDGADRDRYALLKKTLEDNGLSVSALYVSNISQFYMSHRLGHYPEQRETHQGGNWAEAVKNIKEIFWHNQLSLCGDNTLIFNAEPPDASYAIKIYTTQGLRDEVQKQQGKSSWCSSL